MRYKYKEKIKKTIVLVMSTLMLMTPMTSYAVESIATPNSAESENSIVLEKTFKTTNKEDTGRDVFNDTYEKDGVTYELSNITSEILDEETVEGDSYIYTTAGVSEQGELIDPEQTIEHNGTIYQLKSKELKETTSDAFTKHVERTISYFDIEDNDQIPGIAEIVATDDFGNEISKYMPLIDFTIEKENWDSSFEFPIKITDYDADSFMLNGTEVQKGDPLINYEREFLEYLGLDVDYYKINSIEWDGEEYRSNGHVCRNAIAKGDKVIKDITALYGGEMAFGTATLYSYECTYINPEKPDTTIYTVKATATYKVSHDNIIAPKEPAPLIPDTPSQNFFQRMIDWAIENPIAALSIGTLIVVCIVILILFLLSRKKKEEEKEKFDVIDLDNKDK